jgi:predicted outer membrane lipoprotein
MSDVGDKSPASGNALRQKDNQTTNKLRVNPFAIIRRASSTASRMTQSAMTEPYESLEHPHIRHCQWMLGLVLLLTFSSLNALWNGINLKDQEREDSESE